MYYIGEIEGWSVEDQWENGEVPGTEKEWNAGICNIYGNTVKEAVDEAKKQLFGTDDVIVGVRDGKICLHLTTDKDGVPLSKDEKESWKKGEIKAYTTEYLFWVTQTLSEDDLDAEGYEIWD